MNYLICVATKVKHKKTGKTGEFLFYLADDGSALPEKWDTICEAYELDGVELTDIEIRKTNVKAILINNHQEVLR